MHSASHPSYSSNSVTQIEYKLYSRRSILPEKGFRCAAPVSPQTRVPVRKQQAASNHNPCINHPLHAQHTRQRIGTQSRLVNPLGPRYKRYWPPFPCRPLPFHKLLPAEAKTRISHQHKPVLRSRELAYLKSFHTWMQFRLESVFSMHGMIKAAVLPVPFLARASRLRPCKMIGIASSWIGEGRSKPFS